MLPWVMYMVFAGCDMFGDGLLRISEVFEVSVTLESCDNRDLTNPMAANSSWESFLDF
jgi:hypothetical protein